MKKLSLFLFLSLTHSLTHCVSISSFLSQLHTHAFTYTHRLITWITTKVSNNNEKAAKKKPSVLWRLILTHFDNFVVKMQIHFWDHVTLLFVNACFCIFHCRVLFCCTRFCTTVCSKTRHGLSDEIMKAVDLKVYLNSFLLDSVAFTVFC